MLKSTARSRGARPPLQAQAAIEFMILFILFLVAVIVAMMVSMNRSHTISEAQISLESNRVLSDVADRINIAYLEGDGFSMNVTMPERILRMNYTVEISSNEAILRMEGSTFIKHLLTNNVTGNPVKGTNTIRNNNGEIIITEAA